MAKTAARSPGSTSLLWQPHEHSETAHRPSSQLDKEIPSNDPATETINQRFYRHDALLRSTYVSERRRALTQML